MNQLNETIGELAKRISEKQRELDSKIRQYDAKIVQLERYMGKVSSQLGIESDSPVELALEHKCPHCNKPVFNEGDSNKYVVLPLKSSQSAKETTKQTTPSAQQQHKKKAKSKGCSYCNSKEHKRAECPKRLGLQEGV